MLNASDIWQECTELSHKLGIPREEVHKIIMFQFNFIRQVMDDPEEYHDILLHNLLRFTLKYKYKDNKMIDHEKSSKHQQNSNTAGFGDHDSKKA